MKLNKQYYRTAKGETKLNCYKVTITRKQAEIAEIKDTDEIAVTAEKGKITITKERNNG